MKNNLQKSIFLSKLKQFRQNGLINIKFLRNSNGANSSEVVYSEINRMLEAKEILETEEL